MIMPLPIQVAPLILCVLLKQIKDEEIQILYLTPNAVGYCEIMPKNQLIGSELGWTRKSREKSLKASSKRFLIQ